MTNYKKIEQQIKLRKAKEKYFDFVTSLDKKPIKEYFQYGIEARIFKDDIGNILKDHDNLFWGFNDEKYQYLLIRRPVKLPEFIDLNKILKGEKF